LVAAADEAQGVWFNRGLGTHVLSQPAREFVVKVIEMGLYSADFISCHSASDGS
jgi:1,3-beta-glucan synthase